MNYLKEIMNKRNYWDKICTVHSFTKHYLLLAEEMSIEGNTFLQPLKEHRDAYDHIIRVQSVLSKKISIENPDEYMEKNMSKALGHEYRAFFDTADWLTLICRERINVLLNGKSIEDVKEKYPDYLNLKKMLLELPQKIASFRENKDIGKTNESFMTDIDKYAEMLNNLLKYCTELEKAMEDL